MFCMVDKDGAMLEILTKDREPKEGEFKVSLNGYYEVFNEQGYRAARWDFSLKKWVGVGTPAPTPEPQPTELDLIRAEVSSQNQTMSDLLDMLFTHVPELQNI